jgi:alpha-1,3-mannosyl-glycoprotein beta-1,2-N-acetylglucosaminyltransferase
VSLSGILFQWSLDRVFENGHSHMIVMEDDLLASPDFLAYFEQTRGLLDSDPTIWCISSWHDNGFKDSSRDLKRLYRTDIFPGLGWMLKRSVRYFCSSRALFVLTMLYDSYGWSLQTNSLLMLGIGG